MLPGARETEFRARFTSPQQIDLHFLRFQEWLKANDGIFGTETYGYVSLALGPQLSNTPLYLSTSPSIYQLSHNIWNI
jgi:hypothetical protein